MTRTNPKEPKMTGGTLGLIDFVGAHARRKAEDRAFRERVEAGEITNEAIAGGARRPALRDLVCADPARTARSMYSVLGRIAHLEAHPGEVRAKAGYAVEIR